MWNSSWQGIRWRLLHQTILPFSFKMSYERGSGHFATTIPFLSQSLSLLTRIRTMVSGSIDENSLPSFLLRRPKFFVSATVGRLCTNDGKVILGLRLKRCMAGDVPSDPGIVFNISKLR